MNLIDFGADEARPLYVVGKSTFPKSSTPNLSLIHLDPLESLSLTVMPLNEESLLPIYFFPFPSTSFVSRFYLYLLVLFSFFLISPFSFLATRAWSHPPQRENSSNHSHQLLKSFQSLVFIVWVHPRLPLHQSAIPSHCFSIPCFLYCTLHKRGCTTFSQGN